MVERGTEETGEIKRERTRGSLTLTDIVAAAAVIFPSGGGGTKSPWPVCAGDRGSGRWRRHWRWRQPLLTRAGVSGGDRSKELLTGGSWHHTAPAPPRGAASAHLSTGSWNRKSGRVESCVFPSSAVVLLLYFAFPLTHVWKTVSGIKYWYNLMCLILHFAVRVRAPGSFLSIAFGDTRGKKLWTCRGVLLISRWKWKSSYCITHCLISVCDLYYLGTTHVQIWYLPWLLSHFLNPLLSTPSLSLSLSFFFLLPPRLASITMREAPSPLTALSM